MKSPARRKTTKPKTTKPKAPRTSKPKPAAQADPVRRLLHLLVKALDDKKAGDLQVLDVSALSSITDYLVLATGTSEPHLRALRIELERVLDTEKARILGVDTSKGSGWTVVDAFEVMVHVFTPENRAKYRLELLWRDAREVELRELLKGP
jgi:ribosome-associated protein